MRKAIILILTLLLVMSLGFQLFAKGFSVTTGNGRRQELGGRSNGHSVKGLNTAASHSRAVSSLGLK
jgi:hypothetical protein